MCAERKAVAIQRVCLLRTGDKFKLIRHTDLAILHSTFKILDCRG
jgi:hypothetical protein